LKGATGKDADWQAGGKPMRGCRGISGSQGRFPLGGIEMVRMVASADPREEQLAKETL